MTLEECKLETLTHIQRVQNYLRFFIQRLTDKAIHHDETKLGEIEAPIFAEHTANLSKIRFGSDEYKEELRKLAPALEHHYKYNRHHPEYFGEKGIEGMDLTDVLEMFADWMASTERTKNGDIFSSIEINSKRFNIDNQLKQILINTAKLIVNNTKVIT